jgi:hypothetical protein
MLKIIFIALFMYSIFPYFILPSSGNEGQSEWPIITDVEKVFHFDSAQNAAIDLNILGRNGKKLYNLQCHNYLYEGDPDFNYSGEFECRLKSLYSNETYSTLLTENLRQSADWESRARFFSHELIGNCAVYPDYGCFRTFKLRGMVIKFQISDIIFRNKKIKINSSEVEDLELNSFTFLVNVKSDPNAKTAIAEPSVYEEPPIINPNMNNATTRDCSKVKLKANQNINDITVIKY